MPRAIWIYQKGSQSNKLVSVRQAKNLKQGLVDYYEETLATNGYSDPLYTGNSLTVKDGDLSDRTFVAKEAK